MPSSISSSNANERLPQGKWLATWLITLTIVITTTLGWEIYCRTIGFTPVGVADTPELWQQTRKRASALGNDAVILVGASRIQLGINTEVMSRYTPTHPVQLAIDGSFFMPVLENLAADNSITGTIIVDLEIEKIPAQLTNDRTQEIVQFYEKYRHNNPYGAIQPIEDFLQMQINRWFAFRVTGANPQTLLTRALSGNSDPMGTDYLITLPDRSRQADYQKVAHSEAYAARLQRNLGTNSLDNIEPTQWPTFETDVQYLETLVQRIEQRGGKVIFVRFPTDKGIWQIDEARYPRQQFWDKLTKTTSATSIHFKDYPALSRFELPDGSHLDYRDAIPFTEALSRLIFLTTLSKSDGRAISP